MSTKSLILLVPQEGFLSTQISFDFLTAPRLRVKFYPQNYPYLTRLKTNAGERLR